MGTINVKTTQPQDFDDNGRSEQKLIPNAMNPDKNDPKKENPKEIVIQKETNCVNFPDGKEEKVRFFCCQIFKKLQEMQPIIRYLQVKIEAHSFERKYDEVVFVNNTSVLLSLLQQHEHDSCVVNVDVLYERPHENVHLPIFLEQMVSDVPCMTLAVKEELNRADSLPVIWLQLLETQPGCTTNYRDRFDYEADSDSYFLHSWKYQKFIPGEYDCGIFGEKEVYPVNTLPPEPSRTFKADSLAISAKGKVFTITCLINKQAAIRVPWPENSSDFQSRDTSWPSENVVKEIISTGCHAIPKLCTGTENSREWTYEFSLAVMRLESEFSESQRAVYLIFELLVRKYLSFDHSGEIFGQRSYHLKTVMFWTCCEEKERIWLDQPLQGLMALLRNLLLFLRESNCPDFFIPCFNLFYNLGEQKKTVKPIFNRLTKMIPKISLIDQLQKILNKLDHYLTPDLLELKEIKVNATTSMPRDSPIEAKALRFLGDLVQSAMDGSSE